MKAEDLQGIKTPFYYYNTELLKATLSSISEHAGKFGFHVHYALKANCNDRLLGIIKDNGMGADCVSGNEVKKALETGFSKNKIVFAGVGKTDEEILLGLQNDIFCFNCESLQELEVINELAQREGKKAKVAVRINPNVNANTHKYITTGLEENKFGISSTQLGLVLELLKHLPAVELVGLHFHIGSQITDLSSFKSLCVRVNEIQNWFEQRNVSFSHINVGGGLGIDYYHPEESPMADFENYFALFHQFIELRPGQELHFELGRAVVAQCGSLITKTLFIKHGLKTDFVIVDAGMTELIRPALYQSYHKIENISKQHLSPNSYYDVAGPICESSDYFGKRVFMPETERGDLLAIRSAGAYGEVMSSRYNLREQAGSVYSDEVKSGKMIKM